MIKSVNCSILDDSLEGKLFIDESVDELIRERFANASGNQRRKILGV